MEFCFKGGFTLCGSCISGLEGSWSVNHVGNTQQDLRYYSNDYQFLWICSIYSQAVHAMLLKLAQSSCSALWSDSGSTRQDGNNIYICVTRRRTVCTQKTYTGSHAMLYIVIIIVAISPASCCISNEVKVIRTVHLDCCFGLLFLLLLLLLWGRRKMAW